jgi:transposase
VAVHGLPSLSAGDRQALERASRYGATRLIRQRSQIVLLAYDLDTQTQVARAVRCSRATVNRTLQRWRALGQTALPRRQPASSPNARVTGAFRHALAQAMEDGPRAWGVLRPTWTAPLLTEQLAKQTGITVSERTVRRELAALDYVCRRGTWTVRHLAEEQPDYLPKRKGSKRS